MKIKIILSLTFLISMGIINQVNFPEKILENSIDINNLLVTAQAVLPEIPEDPPGNWDAEYPECEFTIGWIIVKTVKGSYRECVSGEGVCLWNDPVCCIRIGGICML